MTIGREIKRIEFPEGSGEFTRYIECDWTDLRPYLPISVRVRDPHFGLEPPTRATAEAARRRRAAVAPQRLSLYEKHLAKAGSHRERILGAVEFVRESRETLYQGLYGPQPRIDRKREKAYLRALSRHDSLVQAFFCFYRPLLIPLDLNQHWQAFTSNLYREVRGNRGEVIGAEARDEAGPRPDTDGLFHDDTPGAFSWAGRYGMFSSFADILLFQRDKRLVMCPLRQVFVECAAREEVNAFLDIAIRVRLTEAVARMSSLKAKDVETGDRYLKRLFVVESRILDEIVGLLGSKESLGLLQRGLFLHGPEHDVQLVRYVDAILHRVEALSKQCALRCGLRAPKSFLSRGLGRMRSLMRDALCASVMGGVGHGPDRREQDRKRGIVAWFASAAYGPKVKHLKRSLGKRTGDTLREIGVAVNRALAEYLDDYRWGDVPVDAYIMQGFAPGGSLYHRAMRHLRNAALDKLQADSSPELERIALQAMGWTKPRRVRAAAAREACWVVKLILRGLSPGEAAEALRRRFPSITAQRVLRVWARTLDKLRRDPRWLAAQQERQAQERALRSRYR